MKGLSSNIQKLILWLTGYVNIIAFILAGGYIFKSTDDEDVKESAKNVLFLYAIFTGINLVRNLIYNIMNVFGASYDALSVVSTIGTVFSIIQAIAFATLFILDIYGIKLAFKAKSAQQQEQPTEEPLTLEAKEESEEV